MLLAELESRGLTHEFDLDGSYPFTRMLRDQIAGRNNSWAVRWHAACFLDGMLTLYPGRSLVHNIGNDASGTHCANTDEFAQVVAGQRVNVERLPLCASVIARDAFIGFFRGRRGSLPRRIGRALRTLQSRFA